MQHLWLTWNHFTPTCGLGLTLPETQESESTLSAARNNTLGASLVAQWLRICLPVQGTRVRALVWEDPTCCGATGPVSHNY